MLILTIIIFILILGVIIFVHELGHFASAKLCKVKVEEFGFGFPPKIFGVKKGETTYSLNWIPIGGFVKLLGEEDGSKDKRSFNMQSIPKRVFIIVSGVLMNFLFAILILTIGFMIGMSPLISSPESLGGSQQTEIIITGVLENSPAAEAGIISGDIVTGFSSIEDFQNYTKSHKNEEVSLNIKENGEVKTINVKLSDSADAPLGVGLVQSTKVKLPFFKAVKAAFVETGKVIYAIVDFVYSFFRDLFTGKKVEREVVGPVGMFGITQQAVKLGLVYVLQLAAYISINLGVINILPFPALDGGKILFLFAEGARGKRVIKMEIENIIHLIGFIILIALIIVVTYNDIVRLIRG